MFLNVEWEIKQNYTLDICNEIRKSFQNKKMWGVTHLTNVFNF